MMIKLLPLLVLSISFSLILTPSPLVLGLWIFLLASTSSILMSLSSSWMGMATFLIYVGGLLVLFAYFLAIQPNQFMNVITLFLFTSFSVTFLNMMPTNLFPHLHFSKELPSVPVIMFNNNMMVLMTLATLLLLIMVVAVKITSTQTGALRPFS